MARSVDEVAHVLALLARGLNDCEIERITGVHRRTVLDWRHGRVPRAGAHHADPAGRACAGCDEWRKTAAAAAVEYAYLLGLYLGDGWISTHARGVFRLRVILDATYPGIIEECHRAMSVVVAPRRAHLYRRSRERAVEVSSFWKHWPCLFPQHGPGPKHERPIVLADWQREIVDRHPWRLLRGLIHSDGCRSINTIHHPKRTYRYPRYEFTNHSEDIRELFCRTCDAVGVEWRRMNRWSVSVARRDSVALMDRFIGPKR